MTPEVELLAIGIVLGAVGTLLLLGVAAAVVLARAEVRGSHMEDWP